MRKKQIGSIILIEHSGKPTVWPVQEAESDDMTHMIETFESSKRMCTYELAQGGTLKLLDGQGNLIREHRGRVA